MQLVKHISAVPATVSVTLVASYIQCDWLFVMGWGKGGDLMVKQAVISHSLC